MRFGFQLLIGLSALGVGCSAPPVKAPAPRVAPVAAAVAPADLPTPPLDRGFAHVLVPDGTGALISLSGRGQADLWILGEEGALLHLSGERVVKTYQPEPCFTQAAFQWIAVAATDGEVRLLAQYQDPGGRLLSAPFDPASGVVGACGDSATFTGLDCPWHHAWGPSSGDGRQCSLGAVALPDFDPFVPRDQRVPIEIAAARAEGDDGWFVAHLGAEGERRSELHRYNGVTWVRVGEIDKGLTYLAGTEDKAGRGWILARNVFDDEGPATHLFRLDGHTLSPVRVPASFEATQVLAAGPDLVWFFGVERKLFEWDGSALREGEAPFTPRDGWGSPAGDLWLLGENPNELAHTTAKGAER